MSRFFSNEQVSLEKQVDHSKEFHKTNPEDVKSVYEIEKCIEWIKANNFRKVCLQFPDHLLPDSVQVCFELQEALNQPVYIMGDTAYESCCLDFIAAAHANAEAIIHYGSICFSQVANELPYLNIYEKYQIDVEKLEKCIEIFLKGQEATSVFCLIDTPYLYKIDEINNALSKHNIKCLQLDQIIDYSQDGIYIFIGNNNRKLENIQFSLNEQYLYQYDPSSTSPSITNFKDNPVILKRRYFLAEKIRDSKTFGIIMGTLAVDNYLKVLGRIKKLLKLNKRKYYIISVGKISVAKLANFPEMDIYIVITCAMNEVYDSKEFYKPIVTPYDVEKAFNPESEGLKFTYDYNSFLDKVTNEDDLVPLDKPDVSLLTGNLRSNQNEEENISSKVALRSGGALVESSHFGAGYLSERSWKGLEQNLGKTEVKLAKEGKTGIAQCYSNESEQA